MTVQIFDEGVIFLFVIIGSSSYLLAQRLTWEEVLSEAKKKNQRIISARQSLNPAKVYIPFEHKHPPVLQASPCAFCYKRIQGSVTFHSPLSSK